jgi:hypothetical protein
MRWAATAGNFCKIHLLVFMEVLVHVLSQANREKAQW